MSNNAQENVAVGDSMSEALLNVNKMLYKMPPALGITQRRNHRTDFFQRSVYTSGTMVLDCQLGSDFCDPKNSYIKWNIAVKGPGGVDTPASFGTGSCANVINRVLVKTRTGKELCRLENANLCIKYNQIYDCPNDWIDSVGKSQGYPDSGNAAAGTSDDVPSGGKTYILPLHCIPCFNTDKLLPPQLMEGIRIEILLEDPAVAFENSAAGGSLDVTSYEVSNPEIHWDAFDIADAYKRKIAEMASRQGLSLIHKEYFHSIVSSNQSNINFDIKKAATKALKVKIITRRSSNVSDITLDGMASDSYNYDKLQAHIGADYFPQQPITVDAPYGVNQNAEAYYNTIFACGKSNQCWYPPSVSPVQFSAADSSVKQNCMVAFNLNKSHVSDLQGYVVNTSRAILVDLQQGVPQDVRLDVYLCHLRAAKVYTSNCEIRD